MDFRMEIDNSRKRCRDESEFNSHDSHERGHVAKKARQFARDAPACDSAPPSPSESAVSTPASMDEDMQDMTPFHAPEPMAQHKPRGTIISGFNQTQARRYQMQGYPLVWTQSSTQVGN
ncbi:hypothetical protein C8A00DRAFT_19522 [Chaetomidium leptoderma]|uniref:Uncharacterized protein n=1 Tax=Chaetomidium leptoderma TaxID=669021 RepID=A0AAN6ZSL2_9PEZI|nr:hypothetical protein C8A00DRAFT_19522 [Chaetomidium leptoderma]